MVLKFQYFLFHYLANPITVPGVIPKECYEPSTNNQFKYDEQQTCEKLITLSMGKVNLAIHSSIHSFIHSFIHPFIISSLSGRGVWSAINGLL